MKWRRKRNIDREIAPDEIFLDATNLPDFDKNRLEVLLEKPIPRSAFAGFFIAIALVFTALGVQAANLQIVKGDAYAAQSERNRVRPEVLFAQRGAVVDRNGVPLVSNESTETGFVKRIYTSPGFGHLLGYVSYPKKDSSGHYYDTEIKGLAGVESSFDSQLAGKNGTLLIEEDALGKVQSSGQVEPAVDGQTVTLSIDARAQKAFYGAVSELADRIPFLGGSAVLMDI
ncbi:MAG: hypothetical protein AAB901_00355, partial [Patescibacteria group bacterium]